MSQNPPRELVDADPNAGTYRATYRYPSRPPTVAVALAVMEITDSGATDLDPLHDAAGVNADALDDMFDPTAGSDSPDGSVTFTYHGYTVTVKSHGRIVVRSPDASTDPPG